MDKTNTAESAAGSRWSRLAPVIILFGCLMQYPGMSFSCPYWCVLWLTTGGLALLVSGFILLDPNRLWKSIASLPRFVQYAGGVLFLIGLFQYLRHIGNYSPHDLGMCLFYVAGPLFGLMYAKELLRILPGLMTLFWCLNLSVSLIQKLYYHQLFFGLASNINWNAAFLLVTSSFSIYWIWMKTKGYTLERIVGWLFVGGFTLWMLIDTESRGAALGAVVAGAWISYLSLQKAEWKRAFRLVFLLCLALGVAGMSFLMKHPGFKKFISEDERIYFAEVTADMILDSPIIGHGAPSFEQEYPAYTTPQAFFLRYTASRFDHPHNDLLYVGAGFGLIGLAAWCLLLFGGLFFAARSWNSLDKTQRLIFALLTALTVHAQFDLIFFQQPTAMLAMLFLGVLWASVDKPQTMQTGAVKPALRILLPAVGVVVTLVAAVSALMTLCGAHLIWSGRDSFLRGDIQEGKRLVDLGQRVPLLRAEQLYELIMLEYYNANDLEQFLKTSDRLKKTAIPDIGTINELRGRTYSTLGRYAEAEQALIRETVLFPLHLMPLMLASDLYLNKMHDQQKFEFAQKCIREIMEKRGMEDDDVELILQNPECDLRHYVFLQAKAERQAKKAGNGKRK